MRLQETVRIPVESYCIQEKINDKTGDVDKVLLEGTAITFDKPTRNRVSYTYESGKQKAESLIGKPFLDTHNDTSIRESPPFGHVENAYMSKDTNGRDVLKYVVDIDPEEKTFIRKAKRGDIPGVSIQVLVDGVAETESLDGNGFLRANIAEFLELSAVLIPGDGDTSMSFMEKYRQGKLVRMTEKGVVDVNVVPGKDGAYEDEELNTSNGDALYATDLPKNVRKVPEPEERNTRLAMLGIKCPACSTQMLEDTFTSKEHVHKQLRCYKCDYIIPYNKLRQTEAVKNAMYRLKFEVLE